MQKRLCAAVKVGMPYEQLHDESHRQVGVILREAGVVTVSADEAVATGVTRAFYPHGLGHSLGIQTHDVGCGLRAPRADNPFLRNTTDVAVGPGLHDRAGHLLHRRAPRGAPREARGKVVDWKAVEALAPLGGVRIEDDVVVEESGVRNLTREQLAVGGGTA